MKTKKIFILPTILEGKGKIVELLGVMGTNVAQNRSDGFNEIIKENPDMEIDGLYAANNEMLLGALEAIEGAGSTADIVKCGCWM